MDTILVGMLSDYLEKTASLSVGVQNLAEKTESYLAKKDKQKTASYSAVKDRATKLAYKLSQTKLPTGQPFIIGETMFKQAQAMLSEHGTALETLDLVLNAVGVAPAPKSKEGSVSIGRVVDAAVKPEDVGSNDFMRSLINK